MPRFFLFLLLTGLAWAEKPSPEKIEFFENRIRPILAQDCYECHRTGGKKKGGLALDHRAAMAEGGDSKDLFDFENPGRSFLIKILRHEEEDMEMPKDGARLDDQVISDFVKWIEMGAPDPRDNPPSDEEVAEDSNWEKVMERRKQWWSFQPVRKVAPPVGDGLPIDRFLKKEIAAAGLEKVERADDRVLIRRLSFALRGLPPSIKEVTTYLADTRPDRWEHLVDDFLASPRFGERWARHWMDTIRYADSHGSEGDPSINNAWRYRDYLIRALNENVPYDTLVTEHLAGDLLENPRIKDGRNESALGTAHLRMVFHGFAPTDALDEKVRFTDDQVNVVTKAFQGLTVSCARCHNHKFDAISQEDYYALFGIFGSTKPGVVRVDAVDEKATRAGMKQLKVDLKQALVKHWLLEKENWSQRFIDTQEDFFKEDERKKNDFLFLRAWDDGRKDMVAYLKDIPIQEAPENQPEWFGRELEGWAKHGEGLEGLSESGAYAIASGGESILTGIYPAGLYSHTISDKDRGVAISPRIELKGDEEVWMRVRGSGNAVVRYSVQNYPRNGTVFPSTDLKNGKWRWIRHDLNYWEGDRIHLELSTAQDQPILAKNDERSWFGISGAVVAKKGSGNPSERELQKMKEFLGANFRPGDTLPSFFERLAGDALSAWANGGMSDSQATFLDELLQIGILPNDSIIGGDLLKKYRELENSLAVPVRAPGVWEADAHDQEFYVRGNHMKPAHLVKRRFLEAIDKEPYETKESGRLELAKDFLRADNPFTARVMVNRVWHHLFGAGLVRTVDNFGRLGEKPSHPELLDYLATRFVEEGWDIKKLIRELVLTEAWQRSSLPGSRAKEKDPDNRLLSHFTLRRLEAEAIRDALIAVSGSLDEQMFGDTVDGNSRRRSVYVRTQRNRLDPFLQTFNAPVPLGGKGRRDETNVPAQSLTMLNSRWVMDLAQQWSDKVQGDTMAAKVTHAYEVAFSRKPNSDELKKVMAFMEVMEAERNLQRTGREKLQGEIEGVEAGIAKIESHAKTKEPPRKIPAENIPKPIARWDFENDARDQIGGLDGELHSGAVIENGNLIVGRNGGCFTSAPLHRDLGEKTLQVLVQLDNLTQQGGGAFGIQTLDGNIFDSIVFAEGAPGQWLPGSEFHSRTQVPGGPRENEAGKRPVWITMTYAKDGMIQVYRDGVQYGKAYRKAGLQSFQKGKAQAIMGFRHGQPGGGRLLYGRIDEARLFDRALTDKEVGLSLGMEMPPSRDEMLKRLTGTQRASLQKLETRLAALRDRESNMKRGSRPSTPLADLTHALFNSKEFIYVR
jgi:hypothetical protein